MAKITLDIPKNRRRAILPFFAFFFFVGIGLFSIHIEHPFLGLFAILFFGTVLIRRLKTLLSPGVLLQIDDDGIMAFNSWNLQRILFSEVTEVSFQKSTNFHLMNFALKTSANSRFAHLMSLTFGGNNRQDFFFVDEKDLPYDFAVFLEKLSVFAGFKKVQLWQNSTKH